MFAAGKAGWAPPVPTPGASTASTRMRWPNARVLWRAPRMRLRPRHAESRPVPPAPRPVSRINGGMAGMAGPTPAGGGGGRKTSGGGPLVAKWSAEMLSGGLAGSRNVPRQVRSAVMLFIQPAQNEATPPRPFPPPPLRGASAFLGVACRWGVGMLHGVGAPLVLMTPA